MRNGEFSCLVRWNGRKQKIGVEPHLCFLAMLYGIWSGETNGHCGVWNCEKLCTIWRLFLLFKMAQYITDGVKPPIMYNGLFSLITIGRVN